MRAIYLSVSRQTLTALVSLLCVYPLQMDGCDAAITTLGGMTGDRRVDYVGNNNVIESAGILGVQRIILVTSIGW